MSSLKKNITYNFIYQFLILFLPFLTAPYLSRVIGAGGVGTYSYSYSVALYFTYFTLLGLNKYGNRSIAECQEDKERRSQRFFEIYCMQAVTFLIGAIVYVVYASYIAKDSLAALIQCLFVLSSLFDINWFFFGMEQFKLTVTRNTVIKIATVVCIFLFVRDQNDIYKYVFIMAISYLISQLCLWPFLKRYVSLVRVKPKNVLKHVKPNLILFIPVIAVSIYRIMDKVMLGSISVMDSVGYYENAEKIVNVPIALITAIGTVMLPRMTALISQNKEEESRRYIDRTMNYVLAFANAAAVGIIAISIEFSVLYYGSGFEYTGTIMKYLAVTIPFLAAGNVVRTQYLIPQKNDKVYLISAILGAAVNVVVNALLIPKYDAVGAAIGTICAEVIVCVFQLICVRNKLPLLKYIGEEVVYLLFAVLMYVCIQLCPDLSSRFLSLMVDVCVGVVVYGLLLLIYWYKRGILNDFNFIKKFLSR